MRLFYSSSSPYSRKVRVAIRELGLADRVHEQECNPFDDPAELRLFNQLSRVPTLVSGELVLFDSPVICEYLVAQAQDRDLLPAIGPERWSVLTAQALADGLLDVAVNMTVERRRPHHEQSPTAHRRWEAQIDAAVDAMEQKLGELPSGLTLGHIAFASALGYLGFRYGHLQWRASHSRLAHWYDEFRQRSSMAATEPSDSSYRLG